ncbi:hypothetical protein M0P48_02150 [Candidatus Gracilibacteria bacterium]|nr:hypothetical protein [Candidatus Gracilibacteria bacterium]
MGINKTDEQLAKDQQYEQDKKVIKVGSHALLVERWPINDKIENCYNENSAYLCYMEQTYLKVPQEESFDSLGTSIHENHKARIKKLWESFLAQKTKLEAKAQEIKKHWANSPKNSDESSRTMVEQSPIEMQAKFKKSAMAIISSDPALETWQTTEKSLRQDLDIEMKTFRIELRKYLEALIEKQGDEYVLPLDHPLRQQIVVHNRYVQLIDAIFITLGSAKKEYYRQKKDLVRKTEAKPTVFHASEVTLGSIRHTVPFIIEETQLDLNPVAIAVAGAYHDIFEDTDRSIEGIMETLKTELDSHDTTIESGFGIPDEKFTAKILDIMNKTTMARTKASIRVLSNNTVLSDLEKKRAITQNLAGKTRTMEQLGITRKDLVRLFPKKTTPPTATTEEEEEDKKEKEEGNKEDPKLKTIPQFPEEYDDGKILRFLIRLHTITGSIPTRQKILVTKNSDRAHNVSTLSKMSLDSQRKTLRGTVSRLIAYQMLDHDHEEMPLYETLSYLIDETVKAYHKFETENPQHMEPIDHELIAQVEKWQIEVIRMELPEKVRKVLERFHEKKAEKKKPSVDTTARP